MQFVPKSDDEINKENLFPTGIYDFEVVKAVDGTSPAGNDKIDLKILVFGQNGNEKTIFDTITPAFAKKFKHFCDTTGLIALYEAGNLTASDCLHMTGKAQIEIQDERFDEEKQKTYKARNVVGDYIKKSISVDTATSLEKSDDDISF